jgi:hypothetical protein
MTFSRVKQTEKHTARCAHCRQVLLVIVLSEFSIQVSGSKICSEAPCARAFGCYCFGTSALRRSKIVVFGCDNALFELRLTLHVFPSNFDEPQSLHKNKK